MEIIAYRNSTDIDVKFEDGTIVEHKKYEQFKHGKIKNPNKPSVYGVGYTGLGKYKTTENGKHTKCYKTWNGMFIRCYDDKYQKREPTYIGCTVCKEWHNFQNFAAWYEKNYYEIEEHKMQLDKDILNKGNKVYSPENCVFVPQNINKLFINVIEKEATILLE